MLAEGYITILPRTKRHMSVVDVPATPIQCYYTMHMSPHWCLVHLLRL